DVQLMGGIVLHEGDIAEMKTGEGKTLVATQPLYLNALSGVNVHLVTVNDYLAKRAATWMQPIYEALGVTVAHIENMMPSEKFKTVSPLPRGIHTVERALRIENLYDPRNVQLVNHLTQGLKAEALFHRDIDYVVQDGEVKIVDEFTGRIMEGRRWSEGLHQAVEAKEGVRIQEENVTVATVTIQNYFRMYEKLAGMTGTAATEAAEFHEIYGLEVVPIPTNVPVRRVDENDLIFKTAEEKFEAVADDIVARHEAGQPVLVGTISGAVTA